MAAVEPAEVVCIGIGVADTDGDMLVEGITSADVPGRVAIARVDLLPTVAL